MKAKVLILIVAYRAENHIQDLLSRIPEDIWDNHNFYTKILVADDASEDNTVHLSIQYRDQNYRKNMEIIKNLTNKGYGGNQKIGYEYAIKHNFDIVILLHGDGQYAPEFIHEMIDPLIKNQSATVFGSRMLDRGGALKGGMPLYKFIGNKILTKIQNILLKSNLSEFHSGYRAYKVSTLKSIPFTHNSNDFDFDTDIIIQLIDNKFTIKEVPIPTFYGEEISYVNGIKYAFDIIKTTVISRIQFIKKIKNPKFDYTKN